MPCGPEGRSEISRWRQPPEPNPKSGIASAGAAERDGLTETDKPIGAMFSSAPAGADLSVVNRNPVADATG